MDKLNVNSSTKYSVVKELNSEFTLVKIKVMALGKNRNMSYFSREIVEAHLNSLNYVPVVAHLFKDEDGNYRIGGHDCYFDENWNLKSLCVPFGVVKADSFGWETVNEYGTDVEYLTCEAILWTGRYPELEETIYSDEIWWNQSMEINCNQYRRLEEDSNYLEVLDFEYSALCLLYKSDDREENVEPCFISADVTPARYSTDEFTTQMNEMKRAMSEVFALENKEGETMDENMNLDQNIEGTPDGDEAVDYEALYQEAVGKMANFTAQVEELQNKITDYETKINELEPYKLAIEKAEREKAEAEIYAKYDEHIGEMQEYVQLKEKSDEYTLEELDKECTRLVGICAMRSFSKKDDESAPFKFSFESGNQVKTSRYGDLFERYGNNNE